MPIAKLCASFVQTASCREGKKKTDYYCNSLPGFILECRANGGKTYALRYRDEHGRQRQYKIADAADITFDKAKKMAVKIRSRVVVGENPAAEKVEKRAIPIYSEIADKYIAHIATYQRSWKSTRAVMHNHVISRWGKLRLTEIHQTDVAAWLAEKAAAGYKPATVERIRVNFQHSFRMAKIWNYPGSDHNPVAGLPRVPLNNSVDRRLTQDEVKRLQKAVASSQNTQLKYIVGMLLLTGARVSELINARWSDVDLEKRLWRIPLSKTGKVRFVPLSQAAIDMLGQLPRFSDCDYLIPNPKTKLPFVHFYPAWDYARKQAGLADVRIHDLRHASASFMINAGIDLYTVGKILGHNSTKTTARYAHLANDTLLAAVEAGAAGIGIDWLDAPAA